MQKEYISTLYELMKNDSNVISCLSDSGTEYDELIAREFPNQVINFGISENNKVAAAAGLASEGKIPFVYTTGTFLAYRSYEFIRDDICLQNRNVKLIGMGTGLKWSTLGPTHHSTEDIAALRSLPNLIIVTPASPKELRKAMIEAYNINGPVYIRIGMSGEKEIYENDYDFKFGKNEIINKGKDGLIFVNGNIISKVIEANNILKDKGLDYEIVNVHTIKPIDEHGIINELKKYKNVYTVEEHNVIGGLGTTIADIIAEYGLSVKLNKIGLEDKFAEGFGTYEEMLKINKLSTQDIYNRIIKKSKRN